MAQKPSAFTTADVTQALETLLAQGWGEMRIVIVGHRIDTVYVTVVHKHTYDRHIPLDKAGTSSVD